MDGFNNYNGALKLHKTNKLPDTKFVFHIITYADHNYLLDCISSIKDTCILTNDIYVLLNSYSTDENSLEFLREKAIKLGFNLIASKENIGLQTARNLLINESYSDYFTNSNITDVNQYKWAVFCDSDVIFKHKTWDGELDYIFDEDYKGKIFASHKFFYPIKNGDHEEIKSKQDFHKAQVGQGYFMAFNTPEIRFSEDFTFWCEDNDITLQVLSQGYLPIQVPHHYLVHLEHKNQIHNKQLFTERNIKAAREKLHKKWYEGSSPKFIYHK